MTDGYSIPAKAMKVKPIGPGVEKTLGLFFTLVLAVGIPIQVLILNNHKLWFPLSMTKIQSRPVLIGYILIVIMWAIYVYTSQVSRYFRNLVFYTAILIVFQTIIRVFPFHTVLALINIIISTTITALVCISCIQLFKYHKIIPRC